MTDQDQEISSSHNQYIKKGCRRCEEQQRNKTSQEARRRASDVPSLERRPARIISSFELKQPLQEIQSQDKSLQCCGAMIPSDNNTYTMQSNKSFSDDAGPSSGQEKETLQRIKLEVEIHTEDLQQSSPPSPMRSPQRPPQQPRPPPPPASLTTASMISLVRWNIGKVLEKNPNIDLKSALTTCHSKLETEPRTGRLCNARTLPDDAPPPPEDRHLNCALLAWQAQGKSDVDRLVEFAITIKQEIKSVEIPDKPKTTQQGVYSGRVVDAFCCPNTSGVGYIGHRPAGMVCPPPAPISTPCAQKEFYEGLTGPVIKLPDHCGCQPREFAPECPLNQGEDCCKLEDLDVPGCLEGGCMERLRALDEAAATLRERATRLSKRDAERAELLERAELAWADMERGYKEQMKQAVDKEDDIARRIKKLVADRNRYKCGCGGKGDELQEITRQVEAERKQLAVATADADAAAVERARLTTEATQCEYDLHEAQCRLAQQDRESKFTEEQERRKATSLAGQLEAERALTREAERALRMDLTTLRDQFSMISEQLLEMDDNNKAIKEALSQLKETKASMIEELENCKHGCDDKMSGIRKVLTDKKEELAKLKDAVVECSCKRPVEISIQVKRTPSLAAMCRCSSGVERSVNDNCSCTSLRTRMMSDLLRDLFTGLQQEMVEDSDEMSCELLKCLADDHQWDKNVLMKQKLKDYFKKFLTNELDIAIAIAIEDYHARWVGQSCVDAERAAVAAREALLEAAVPVPCVCIPGSAEEDCGPAAQAWQRTQADVFQLTLQLQQLKQESIRRADLKSMEDNLVKIVENIAKPKPHIYVSAETETPMLQSSDDVCFSIDNIGNEELNITPFTYPKPSVGPMRGKKSTSVNKKHTSRPRNVTPSTKVEPCKSSKGTSDQKKMIGERSEHEKKQARTYVPSMTSVDICIRSSQRTGSPRRLSQYSRLLNSVSLDGDRVTQPDCSCTSPHGETATHTSTNSDTEQSLRNIFISRNLMEHLSSKILQGCSCTSECNCFNKLPAEIDIDELMKQMFECCKLSTGRINKEDFETIFDVEKKTSKTLITDGKFQKDTYNELIMECMRSYTANKNIFIGFSEQTLSKPLEKESAIEDMAFNCGRFTGNDKIVNIMTGTDRCGCSKGSKSSMSGKKKKSEHKSGISKSLSKSTNKGSGEPVLAASTPGEAQACAKCKCRDGPRRSKVFFKSESPSTKASEFINTVNLDRSSEGILCKCPKPDATEEDNFVSKVGKYINNVKSKIFAYKKSITTMFDAEKGKCRCEDELGPYLKKLREESKNLKKQLTQTSKSASDVIDQGTTKMEKCPGSGACMESMRSSKSSTNCFSKKRSGSIASSKHGSITSSKKNSKYHKNCTVEMPRKQIMSRKERKEQQEKYTFKSKKSAKTSKNNKNEQQHLTSKKLPCKKCECDGKDREAKNEIQEEKTLSNDRNNDFCVCQHCQGIITQKPNSLVKGTCHCKQSKCMYCDKMKNNNESKEIKTFPTVKSKSEVTPCCCEYNLKFLGATVTESGAVVGDQFADVQGRKRASQGSTNGLIQGKQSSLQGPMEGNTQVGIEQSNINSQGRSQDQTQNESNLQNGSRTQRDSLKNISQDKDDQSAGGQMQEGRPNKIQGSNSQTAQGRSTSLSSGLKSPGKITQQNNENRSQTAQGRSASLSSGLKSPGKITQQNNENSAEGAQDKSRGGSTDQEKKEEGKSRRSSTVSMSGTRASPRDQEGNAQGGRRDSKLLSDESGSKQMQGENIKRTLSRTSRTDSKCEDWCDEEGKSKDYRRMSQCSPVCGCDLCCMAANKTKAAKRGSDTSNTGFGLGNNCKCSCSVGSATHGPMETKAIQSTSAPSNEECVCCTSESNKKFSNPMTDELELNAFQLLQKYVHCKIKKMKCPCCPHDEIEFNEEVKFSKMIDKVKQLIHSDIERLACRCQEQYELENNEIMAFSLLEEYVRSKINDISCSCAKPNKSNNESICETTLASIKDVIQNDLADLSCCCKTDKDDCMCVDSELPPNRCVCVKSQNNSPVICSCDASEDNIKRPSHNTKSQTKAIEIKSKSKTSVIELESDFRVPCHCQNAKGIELRSESKSEVIGGGALKHQGKHGNKKCGCPERLSCANGENVVEIISESKTSLVKVSSGTAISENIKESRYSSSKSNDNITPACCTTKKPSVNTYTCCVPKQSSVKRMLCAKPATTRSDASRLVEIKTGSRTSVIKVDLSVVKAVPTKQCPKCNNRKKQSEKQIKTSEMCTNCGQKKDNIDMSYEKKSCTNIQTGIQNANKSILANDQNYESACGVCKRVSKEKSGSFVSGKKTCMTTNKSDQSEKLIELRSEDESSWVQVRDEKSSQRSSVNFSDGASLDSVKLGNSRCCANTKASHAPQKCTPHACASKQNTTVNKSMESTKPRTSASNITSGSTAPYAGFTLECSCDTNMQPCTCSSKSSKLKEASKKDSCECTMVPLCQVKLLVKDIELKLQSDDCTCETFSPLVCPVHAKKEIAKSTKVEESNNDSCSICRRQSSNLNVTPGGSQICNLCNCVDKLRSR